MPKSFTKLADMMTKSSCGENLVTKAMQEVGILQYLETARTGAKNHKQLVRVSGGQREAMRRRGVRIKTYLGREVGLVVEWASFGVIVGGHNLGWW